MRRSGNYDFDLDIELGEVAEELLAELFCGDLKVEVKRDFRVSETGRVAIEYRSRGQNSGIRISRADWWAFALSGACYDDEMDRPEVVVFIRKSRLKRILNKLLAEGRLRRYEGGDTDDGGQPTSAFAALEVAALVAPLEVAS